jgi:hypothetical protein
MKNIILTTTILLSILLTACSVNNYYGYEGNFSFDFRMNWNNDTYDYYWMNGINNVTCKEIKYGEPQSNQFRFYCIKEAKP